MYKLVTLLALTPALAIHKFTALGAALKVRGGTFGFDARETGEACGINEPEKVVVKTIKGAVTYPLKVLGIRGGALLDVSARETGELCDIEEPEREVVKTIKRALGIRGGAFDIAARETAEQCDIEDCEHLVVKTIKRAFGVTAARVLASGVVPEELAH